MKFMHLSDLHLGKKLHEFSLYEDQKYILKQIVDIAQEQKPDCVLIAGDVYDKAIPSAEAVTLFDNFLNQLTKLKLTICVIAGNHDSAERLAFGSQLMSQSGVYMASAYNGQAQKVVLQDEYGPVHIFLLPFLKPALVKHYLPAEEAEQITTYHEALKKAVELLNIDKTQRNILLAHQFVTGAISAGSEAVNVGGLDNIGADVFSAFDYVALGHIHNPQNVGGDIRIRYSGTPLKYSFAECKQEKSVTFVELGEKGTLEVNTVALKPLHELRKLKGCYKDLMFRDYYRDFPFDDDGCLHDFYYLTLTDEQDVVNALQYLRSVYKNLLQLDYDNLRTRTDTTFELAEQAEEKTPLELIDDFFYQQNNQKMNKKQQDYLNKSMEKIGGESL